MITLPRIESGIFTLFFKLIRFPNFVNNFKTSADEWVSYTLSERPLIPEKEKGRKGREGEGGEGKEGKGKKGKKGKGRKERKGKEKEKETMRTKKEERKKE